VQAQNLAGFRDAHNQGFALARSSRELGAPLAKNKDSAWTLPFDQNHGMFRKNRGMLDPIERFDRIGAEVTEKIAIAQTAGETAFDASQTGNAHGLTSISSQTHARLTSNDEEQTAFKSHGWPERFLREGTTRCSTPSAVPFRV
jgi:hypothetical protein